MRDVATVALLLSLATDRRFKLLTLLLKGALRGFFAIATIVLDFLLARRDCAGNAGRELDSAPLKESLLVCMLDRTVIDMLADTTCVSLAR